MTDQLLLILGILGMLLGAAALFYAALQRHGYYHLSDGEAALYRRLRRRSVGFFAAGAMLAAIGFACVLLCN